MVRLWTRSVCTLVGAVALALATVPAMAAEVQHYKGKKPESLEEAVALFKEYNAKLEKILADKPLSDKDMQRVHELSYTLENALGKINAEMLSLTKTLEAVHKASERRDAETVSGEGRKYLSVSKTVTE